MIKNILFGCVILCHSFSAFCSVTQCTYVDKLPHSESDITKSGAVHQAVPRTLESIATELEGLVGNGDRFKSVFESSGVSGAEFPTEDFEYVINRLLCKVIEDKVDSPLITKLLLGSIARYPEVSGKLFQAFLDNYGLPDFLLSWNVKGSYSARINDTLSKALTERNGRLATSILKQRRFDHTRFSCDIDAAFEAALPEDDKNAEKFAQAILPYCSWMIRDGVGSELSAMSPLFGLLKASTSEEVISVKGVFASLKGHAVLAAENNPLHIAARVKEIGSDSARKSEFVSQLRGATDKDVARRVVRAFKPS
ncbi:MAG: hypothetical protein K2Q34_08845 [Alphaproteobacteria bacterium]|nr:hypothetical protein [Alphaproteobacteria bacterium]